MGAVLSQSNEIGEVYIEQHVDALLENPPISFPAILFLSYPKSKSLVAFKVFDLKYVASIFNSTFCKK